MTFKFLNLAQVFLGLISTAALAETPRQIDIHKAQVFAGDLDMTGREYASFLWSKHEQVRSLTGDVTDPLQAILATGKRNLDWLDFINASRTAQTKLELSTPATQAGNPITQARKNNREIVSNDWENLKVTLAPVVAAVLVNQDPFTTELGISDDQFLDEIRKVDRIYQMASRWLLQEPYLDSYTEGAVYDLRGFYYLQQEPDLEHNLNNFDSLDLAKQTELKGWLLQECVNANLSKSSCAYDLDQAVLARGLAGFHANNLPGAQAVWDSFFKIDATRRDVKWTSRNPNSMTIPFRDPQSPSVLAWLRDNIQDEFKWNGWALHLDFKPTGNDTMTHVVFKEGATPHVNELAGSEITMDGNRNIDEYSSRWTIRHEYGHVLGLPDCYIEFYDESEGVMISYQLDITNLMCSRRGHLQERHFDELKRVYLKP